MTDYSKPFLDINNLLPSVFKTRTSKAVIDTLFNRFLTKDETVDVNGWVGKKTVDDVYITQNDPYRKLNQLEPVRHTKIGSTEYVNSFLDLLNHLELSGAKVDEMDNWLNQTAFNFAPPINYDKFCNFSQYFWYGHLESVLDHTFVPVFSTQTTYPVLTASQQTAFSAESVVLKKVLNQFVLPKDVTFDNQTSGNVEYSFSNSARHGVWTVTFTGGKFHTVKNGGEITYAPVSVGETFEDDSFRFKCTGSFVDGEHFTVQLSYDFSQFDDVVFGDCDATFTVSSPLSAGSTLTITNFGSLTSGDIVVAQFIGREDGRPSYNPSGKPQYYVIQRSGTYNDWQKQNCWIHKDDFLSSHLASGMNSFTVNDLTPAAKPIIEYDSAIQMNSRYSSAGPCDSSTVGSTPWTQVKTRSNQAPLFDLYDSVGIHTNKVSPIIYFVEDPSAEYDEALDCRPALIDGDLAIGCGLADGQTHRFYKTSSITGPWAGPHLVGTDFYDSNMNLSDPLISDGAWRFPDQMKFNPEHVFSSSVRYGVMFYHLADIISKQPGLVGSPFGNNNSRHLAIDPAKGGLIKDVNGEFAKMFAILSANEIDMPTMVNFMKTEYQHTLAKIRSYVIDQITNISTTQFKPHTDIDNFDDVQLSYFSKMLSALSDANYADSVSIPGFIPTLPFFGLAPTVFPEISVDPYTGLLMMTHHDGHKSLIQQSTAKDLMAYALIEMKRSDGEATSGIIAGETHRSNVNFKPYNGQIWFNTDDEKLYYFNAGPDIKTRGVQSAGLLGVGDGSITDVDCSAYAPVGEWEIVCSSIDTFQIFFESTLISSVKTGTYYDGDVKFTVVQGNVPFQVGDKFTLTTFQIKPQSKKAVNFTFSGQGNPNLTLQTVYEISTTPAESWTLTARNSSTFAVVGSISGIQPDATVGSIYDNGKFQAIITSSLPVSAGDTFRFDIIDSISSGDYFYDRASDALYRYDGSNVAGWIPRPIAEKSDRWFELDVDATVYAYLLRFERDLAQRSSFVETKTLSPVDARLLEVEFLKYCAKNDLEPYLNGYDDSNPFSWNYSSAVIPSVTTGTASWREIYKQYWGTARPDLEPWVMLGEQTKPSWWDSTYPPVPGFLHNPQVWTDIQAVYPTRKLCVDPDSGQLLPPFINPALPVSAHVLLNTAPDSRASQFSFGQLSDSEVDWRLSVDYLYDVVQTWYRSSPMNFFDLAMAVPHKFDSAGHQIDIEVDGRVNTGSRYIHGDKISQFTIASSLNLIVETFPTTYEDQYTLTCVGYTSAGESVFSVSSSAGHVGFTKSGSVFSITDQISIEIKPTAKAYFIGDKFIVSTVEESQFIASTRYIDSSMMQVIVMMIRASNQDVKQSKTLLFMDGDWMLGHRVGGYYADDSLKIYSNMRYDLTVGQDLSLYGCKPFVKKTLGWKKHEIQSLRVQLVQVGTYTSRNGLIIPLGDGSDWVFRLEGFNSRRPIIPVYGTRRFASPVQRYRAGDGECPGLVVISSVVQDITLPETRFIIEAVDAGGIKFNVFDGTTTVQVTAGDEVVTNTCVFTIEEDRTKPFQAGDTFTFSIHANDEFITFEAFDSRYTDVIWKKYDHSRSQIEQFALGQYVVGIQSLVDILMGYVAVLEQDGWNFTESARVDETSGRFIDWQYEIERMIDSIYSGAVVPGDGVILNPMATSVAFNTQHGVVADLFAPLMNTEETTQTIYDVLGNTINPADVRVIRDDQVTIFKTNDIIAGMSLFVDEYEHLLVFNNIVPGTSDGILFAPEFGTIVDRIFISGRKSINFSGRLTFGGHYLSADGQFKRNIETAVGDVNRFYDVTQSVSDEARAAALDLVGYTDVKYLDEFSSSDKTKFAFWQGIVQHKGSNTGLSGLSNSKYFSTSEVDEYWAIKLTSFGSAGPNKISHVQLKTSDVRTDGKITLTFDQTVPGTYIRADDTTRRPFSELDDEIFFHSKEETVVVDHTGVETYIDVPRHVHVECLTPSGVTGHVTNYEEYSLETYTDFERVNSTTVRLFGSNVKTVIVKCFTPDRARHTPPTINEKIVEVWDPAAGYHFLRLEHDVDYISDLDPAFYSSSRGWGERQVGKVWFDTRRLSYCQYYDRHDIWGRQTDFSRTEIASWIQSPVAPTEFSSYVASIPSLGSMSVHRMDMFKRDRTWEMRPIAWAWSDTPHTVRPTFRNIGDDQIVLSSNEIDDTATALLFENEWSTVRPSVGSFISEGIFNADSENPHLLVKPIGELEILNEPYRFVGGRVAPLAPVIPTTEKVDQIGITAYPSSYLGDLTLVKVVNGEDVVVMLRQEDGTIIDYVFISRSGFGALFGYSVETEVKIPIGDFILMTSATKSTVELSLIDDSDGMVDAFTNIIYGNDNASLFSGYRARLTFAQALIDVDFRINFSSAHVPDRFDALNIVADAIVDGCADVRIYDAIDVRVNIPCATVLPRITDGDFSAGDVSGWVMYDKPQPDELLNDSTQYPKWIPVSGDWVGVVSAQRQRLIDLVNSPLLMPSGVEIGQVRTSWTGWEKVEPVLITQKWLGQPFTVDISALHRYQDWKISVFQGGVLRMDDPFSVMAGVITVDGAFSVGDEITVTVTPFEPVIQTEPSLTDDFSYKFDADFVFDGESYYFWARTPDTKTLEQQIVGSGRPFLIPSEFKPAEYDANLLMIKPNRFVACELINCQALSSSVLSIPTITALRSDLNSLHEKVNHSEWVLVSEKQTRKVPLDLWEKVVDSVIGQDAAGNQLPYEKFVSYDREMGTNERFGFELGQIVIEPEEAQRIIKHTILNPQAKAFDPVSKQYTTVYYDTIDLANLDKYFVNEATIREFMTTLRAGRSQQVNEIFFNILLSTITKNKGVQGIMKTSFISVNIAQLNAQRGT
jgi:hypothetical protein